MPTFRTLRVAEILMERPGLQRLRLADGSRAFALTATIGYCAVDDEVVVNTTAVEHGLGTGGWHVVHWNLANRDLTIPGGGHIMKLRYTSLQLDTGTPEEHGLAAVDRLDGRPVMVASLHSQVGILAAVAHSARPGLRLAYVMTDGAALPVALSDVVADLRDRGLLQLVVSAGHAFGGDLEAVNVPHALGLAAASGAEAIIVAMGPGVVGTGSRLGTTALETAGALDMVDAMGGIGIATARVSGVDPRDRHRGLSHHTRTALELCRVPALVALPDDEPFDALAAEIPQPPHAVMRVEVADVEAVLAQADLAVTTMGRGPADDPAFFLATAAGAVAAVRYVSWTDTVLADD